MPLTPEQLAREKINAEIIACRWVIQPYKDCVPFAPRAAALIEVASESRGRRLFLLVEKVVFEVLKAAKESTTLSSGRGSITI
jgi:hypothetical protein